MSTDDDRHRLLRALLIERFGPGAARGLDAESADEDH
jgi:hypothetical protein